MVIIMRSFLVYFATSMFILGTCIQPRTAQSFQSTASESLKSSLQKINRLPRDTELKNEDCGSTYDVKSSDLNEDPSAAESYMSQVFLTLLHKFGFYSRDNFSSPEDYRNFQSVLRLELMTIFTGNHLVLPISDEQTEGVLSEKAKLFFNNWFDITQAEEFDNILDAYMDTIVYRYLTPEDNVTVDIGLIKDFLASYNVTPSLMVPRVPPPKVYFPLEDLIEKKPLTGARFAEWLLNFDIRKCLLHRRFLYHIKKPVHGLFPSDEDSKYWDSRYDTLLRAILERAKTRKEMKCIYERTLNEFVQSDFKANDFPKKMVQDFKESLVYNIFMEDSDLAVDIVAQSKALQAEELKFRTKTGRYNFSKTYRT